MTPARTAVLAAGGALSMLGLAYASVPLYRMFCEVTGFAGTTQRAEAGATPVATAAGERVLVRFDANTAPGMPWRFAPTQRVQNIRIGQRTLAFYTATSTAREATHGTAVFNVSPDTVGQYFTKIECFCFQEQTLSPGQTVQMPIVYYIDPAFLKDPQARKVEEITLSYTFFPARPEPDITAAAAPAGPPPAAAPAATRG